MFKKILCGCSLALALATSVPVMALPITGEVVMQGAFVAPTDLATATSLDFREARTTGGTESYAAAAVTSFPVYFTDFTFSPFLSPAPLNPLWWFTDGSLTYQFVMNDVSIVAQSSSLLQLVGSGMLHITGFDPTPGIWEFSSGINRSGFFKFTSDSHGIPEPGSLALLGLGLLGFGLARRRKA